MMPFRAIFCNVFGCIRRKLAASIESTIGSKTAGFPTAEFKVRLRVTTERLLILQWGSPGASSECRSRYEQQSAEYDGFLRPDSKHAFSVQSSLPIAAS